MRVNERLKKRLKCPPLSAWKKNVVGEKVSRLSSFFPPLPPLSPLSHQRNCLQTRVVIAAHSFILSSPPFSLHSSPPFFLPPFSPAKLSADSSSPPTRWATCRSSDFVFILVLVRKQSVLSADRPTIVSSVAVLPLPASAKKLHVYSPLVFHLFWSFVFFFPHRAAAVQIHERQLRQRSCAIFVFFFRTGLT